MSWLTSLASDFTDKISSVVEEHLPTDQKEDAAGDSEKSKNISSLFDEGAASFNPTSLLQSINVSAVSNFKPSSLLETIDTFAASVAAPLASEHQNLTSEHLSSIRKEHAFDRFLPWETEEEEKEILSPEVREVILKFGQSKAIFEGPFLLKNGMKCTSVKGKEDDKDKEEEVVFQKEEDDALDEVGAILKDTDEDTEKKEEKEEEPDFPFDLDSHLGLIRRIMEIDEQLVEAQKKWCSGGGEREVVFWRNYFYHCACAREAAGLSTAEIWGESLGNLGREGGMSVHRDDNGASVVNTSEQREKGGNIEVLSKNEPSPSQTASEDYEIVNREEKEGGLMDEQHGDNENVAEPDAGVLEKDIEDLDAEIERELANM